VLADEGAPPPQKQGLLEGLHRAGTQFRKLIDFIASHLPKWRDDPRRKAATAEDLLSEHLCDYLNDEARNMPGIESFKFGREPRDEVNAKGNLDISAKPVGDWLTVEARHYSTYDTFLPIECKRLPMPEPKRKDRDHREYLYDQYKSAGGVQRFKASNHGAKHAFAAMIGYVQSGRADEWLTTINGWVAALAETGADGWSEADTLSLDGHDQTARFALLSSRHKRASELNDIDLKHLWIEM
jgi:hypothetical protein